MKRVALVLVLVLAVGTATACSSGSGSGSGSGSSGSKPVAATTHGSEGGASNGNKGSNGNAGSPAPKASTPSSARTVQVAAGKVRYGVASAEMTRRFAACTGALKGVYKGVQFKSATQSGQEIGGVAVYTFTSSQAGSKIFRAQLTNQLAASAVGAKTAAPGVIGKTTVATASAAGGAVAWFSGTTAVVVLSPAELTQAKALATAYLQPA